MFHPFRSLALLALLFPCYLRAQTAPTDTPTASPVPTNTPSPIVPKNSRDKISRSPRTIVVHKPQPPGSWGKVVQYKREDILALSEKNRETLHEFVFQDENGIIRTATYHENADGEGYWEVWVWDQP
ncbi:MAG TPA: hypothetical protein VHE12_07200 [bacterium]|nr:hypothetical protein [bacterium]